MNKFLIFLLSIAVLAIGCKDDDDAASFDDVLKYDGANNNAPFFDAGTYEAAARFNAADIGPYEGRVLEEIEVYMHESLPDECHIKVYKGGSNNAPSDLIYEADITANIATNLWVSHILTEPITLETDEYWLAVRVEHSSLIRSFGCDAGPADSNGQWLWSSADNAWISFSERNDGNPNAPASAFDVNWNIRGHLNPE